MRRIVAVLGFIGLLALAGNAQALPVTGGGVASGSGCVQFTSCPNLPAGSAGGLGAVYVLESIAAASGTLTLNTGAGTLDFSIDVASSVWNAASGSDNGTSSIEFVNTNYSGSVAVTQTLPNNYSVDAGQFAAVAGDLTPTGGASDPNFSAAQSLLSGECVLSGASVSCGLLFAEIVDFNFLVNGQGRDWTHKLDVTAIPEPSTGLLVGGGLFIAQRGRPTEDFSDEGVVNSRACGGVFSAGPPSGLG